MRALTERVQPRDGQAGVAAQDDLGLREGLAETPDDGADELQHAMAAVDGAGPQPHAHQHPA